MKVKYIGEYCFSSGLSYGSYITVEVHEPGYIIGKTENGKRVVVENERFEYE